MSEINSAFRVLRGRGWFSQINWKFQEALAREARLVRARRGEQIFHFGDPGAGLFGVVSGSVLLSFPREDGILLPLVPLGCGFWVGDLAVLSGKPGIISIETHNDLTAVNISADKVLKLARDMPDIYRAFYELNRINIHLLLRLMTGLTADTADRKIAFRLLILSNYAHGADGWLDLTNHELAAQLGLSLPTVQRAVKRLERNGFLERGYSRIRISDRSAISLHE